MNLTDEQRKQIYEEEKTKLDLTPEYRQQIYKEEKAKIDAQSQTTTQRPTDGARKAKKSQFNKVSWLLFAVSVLLYFAGLWPLAALCFVAAFVLAVAIYLV